MQLHAARDVGAVTARSASARSRRSAFPASSPAGCARTRRWRPIEQATMSYGYGLSASLFQIAHAYTVFAHDGELIPVTLTRPIGSEPAPVAGVRVLSPKTAPTVRDMLHLVTLPGGTGAEGADRWATRSAARAAPRYKQEGAGYATKKYRAWFVGMAPIAHPRIIVAVMVDEPSGRQVLRRRRRRAGVQRGRAADAAHDGRAARPRRQAADRLARHAGRRGKLLMADGGDAGMARLESREAAHAWLLLRERRRARRRQPARAARATPSSPGRATPRRPPLRRRRARRRRERLPGRGRRRRGVRLRRRARASRALRGLKAAAGRHRQPLPRRRRASKLDVVAVTGTNGKTSTAWWIAQALGALGRRCGVVGTLGIGEPPRRAGGRAGALAGADARLRSTGLTTPDPVTLQNALDDFVDARLRGLRDRGVVDRHRRAPPRRHAGRGRGVHQLHARTISTTTATCAPTGRPRRSCSPGRACARRSSTSTTRKALELADSLAGSRASTAGPSRCAAERRACAPTRSAPRPRRPRLRRRRRRRAASRSRRR